MQQLTPSQRRFLRSRAHGLRAGVLIGRAGMTAAVKQEIDRHLSHHELVKVKVASEGRDAREAILAQLCAGLQAAAVQHVGKILVLYRPAAEPKLLL